MHPFTPVVCRHDLRALAVEVFGEALDKVRAHAAG
jgi:hypothetical protein